MLNAFLRLIGLKKSFDGLKIIDNLDLAVEKGRILAILGPSGCGKSTTLRIIAGLLDQEDGEVWVGGKRIDDLSANRRKIGFVFQNYSLFPNMTVRGNIGFGMRIRKMEKASIDKKVKELIILVGLEGLEDRRPAQLSGGQQQRVALARALAVEPDLLLLDEPFGALDAKIRRRLRRDLKRLQETLGITTIFVTHDQEEAFEVGHNIAVMNKGRIEQIGLPRDLYDEPKTRFVAKFVGNINVITLPASETMEETEVMVRPEDVIVKKVKKKIGQHGVRGVLTNYTFLGPYIEAKIDLANNETMTSIMPKSEFIAKGLRRGDRIRAVIKAFRSFPKSRDE